MDDNARNKAAYQLDQGILDARGIKMTVEEVAGLSTCKYSERVHSLKLSNEDLAFLKGLRRRIKNRLASQNSRRRSVEHLRRLTRELRAVRACRRDALADRRQLLINRDRVRDRCSFLRRHLTQILNERGDLTEVPDIEVKESLVTSEFIDTDVIPKTPKSLKTHKALQTHKSSQTLKSQKPEHISVIVKNKNELEKELNQVDVYEKVRRELQDIERKKETIILKEERIFEDNTIIIKEEVPDYDDYTQNMDYTHSDSQSVDECKSSLDECKSSFDECKSNFGDCKSNFDDCKSNFGECKSHFDECQSFDKYLPSDLTNDIFECKIGKLVHQSVNHMFNNNDRKKVFAKTVFIANEMSSDIKSVVLDGSDEVLNLSVKEGRRKSHGRKQSAPRRITCFTDDDGVLDLKIKK